VVTVRTYKITEKSAGFCDIIDLTAKITKHVEHARIRQGLVSVFVTGSTAGITTLEHEPGLVQDLKELVEKLIPSDRRYHHDDRWGDDNGFSHLRASLFGPSLSIPVEAGRLLLGTWQQVILLDFDNRSRTREIIVQVLGESE
jgi:secondary thiamine-phosphate synthase enzyme